MNYQLTILRCVSCNRQFNFFTAHEQKVFALHHMLPPKRCKYCRLSRARRQKTRAEQELEDDEELNENHEAPNENHEAVICSKCELEFNPTTHEVRFYTALGMSVEHCGSCRKAEINAKKEDCAGKVAMQDLKLMEGKNCWASKVLVQLEAERKMNEAKMEKPMLARSVRVNMSFGGSSKTVVTERNVEELERVGREKLKIKKKDIIMKSGGAVVTDTFLEQARDGIAVLFFMSGNNKS